MEDLKDAQEMAWMIFRLMEATKENQKERASREMRS